MLDPERKWYGPSSLNKTDTYMYIYKPSAAHQLSDHHTIVAGNIRHSSMAIYCCTHSRTRHNSHSHAAGYPYTGALQVRPGNV
jgi:hypothetical protein